MPDDGKDKKRYSEASLPNAIENEDEESNDAVEVEVNYPPEGFEISDDYQLQQAIEFLKSGTYAEKLAELQG